MREHAVYRVIFLIVLAPIGAVVVVAALLLFGVNPHSVFLAGHIAKSGLEKLGFHAPNSVGVLITVLFWWMLIVISGLAWERRRQRTAGE